MMFATPGGAFGSWGGQNNAGSWKGGVWQPGKQESQPSARSAAPPATNMGAWGQPQQQSGQQQSPRPSNSAFADAWNLSMGGNAASTARTYGGGGAGNLAYMPDNARPAPFSSYSIGPDGRQVTQQQALADRDSFIGSLLQDNAQQAGRSGVQMGPPSYHQAAVQDLFARNNIQAPPGFMDQLLGVLGQQAPPPQMPLAPPAGAWNGPDPRFMGPAMLPQQQAPLGQMPWADLPRGISPDLYQRPLQVGEMTPEARRSRMDEDVRIANLQEQARAATPGGGPGGSGTLLAPQQPAQWQPGQAQPIQPQSQGTTYTPPAEPQSLEQKKRELYAKIKAPGAIPWPTTKEEMATYEQRKLDQEDEVWDAKRQYAALNGQQFSEPKPSVARAEKAAREKADGEERAKIREIERVNKNTDWFTRDVLSTAGQGHDYTAGRIEDIEGAVDKAIAAMPPDQRAVAEQWRELSYSNASDDQWRGAMKKFRSLQQQARALAAPPPPAPAPAPARAAPVRQPWRARR